MTRKIIALLGVLFLTLNAQSSIVHTNTESFTLADSADGSYTDFKWNWAGYDNEAMVLTWDTAFPAGTKASYRMRRPKDGLIYKEVLTGDITVSGTSITFSVAGGTNMVPVGAYWAEVITYDTATNVYRSVAQGMVNVNWSLFKDDATYFQYYTNIHSLAASLIYLGATSYPGNVTFYGAGVQYDSVNNRLVFSGVGTGAVASVFGRTGVVEAEVGDYSAFYSLTGHVHSVAQVTGLQAALDGKGSTASVALVQSNLDTHEGLEGTNVHGLGTMAIVDDAPSDGSAYVRQDGVWTNAAAAGGYVGTNAWAQSNAVFEARLDTLEAGVYMITYNAGDDVLVRANKTNVTATLAGTTYTVDGDAGTQLEMVEVRHAVSVGDSYSLVVTTNVMPMVGTRRVGNVFQAYNEANGNLIAGAQSRPDAADDTKFNVIGISAGGMTHALCKHLF